jgi:hypothetical protein
MQASSGVSKGATDSPSPAEASQKFVLILNIGASAQIRPTLQIGGPQC